MQPAVAAPKAHCSYLVVAFHPHISFQTLPSSNPLLDI
jgi:hypothetical protein